jgi:hypothetical protein
MTITTEAAQRRSGALNRERRYKSAEIIRLLVVERDALQAERDMLKRDNEIMVGMINDMGTIFIKARAALGETQ